MALIKLKNPMYDGTNVLEDITGPVSSGRSPPQPEKIIFPPNIKAYLERDKTGGPLPQTYEITVKYLEPLTDSAFDKLISAIKAQQQKPNAPEDANKPSNISG